MRYNPAARELVLKIVYYGPGLGGKTSNLQVVHDRSPHEQVTDLVSVDTHSERTLHFDWLALDLGQVQGHHVRFEFFTVPGQNYYAATRRQVLTGADGVVFVADSRREALDENIDSMNELLNNLRHHGLPEDLPVVMQYNKQDLPTALKAEQLEPLMNVRGWPSFAACALKGDGVLETVRAVAGMAAEVAGRAQLPDLRGESESLNQPVAGEGADTTRSWLISCYRCQTILEVPDASLGAIYTCGVCSTTLEVHDTERGLTGAPKGQAPAGSGPLPGGSTGSGPISSPGTGSLPRSAGDESAYGLQTLPVEGSPALASRPGTEELMAQAQRQGLSIGVEGYHVLVALDESVQGRRWRVRELATGRNLRALSLAQPLLRQPGYRDSLEPYVRLAGPLKHPNILPLASLKAAGENTVLLALDPADHEPLSHVLARRRALAPPHAMGLLRQIALALEEAARHGVVHGWLRPDVILVSPDGGVLIDELYVPKSHRFLVRELSGASAATEYYLAPEHLNEDARSDLRSDIFMLGALFYRMITGEGLVTGYSAHEALHKVFANGPRPLRTSQAGVSRDLDQFYQRMVATERKDRFQAYRELIDSLDKFGGGAKRQTLRLTGSVNSSGTGRIRQASTGSLARRQGSSGGYANLRQNNRGSSGQVVGPAKRHDHGNGATVVVVTVVVLALVAGGIWFVDQQRKTNQRQREEMTERERLRAERPPMIPPKAVVEPATRANAAPVLTMPSATVTLVVPPVPRPSATTTRPSEAAIDPSLTTPPATVPGEMTPAQRRDLRTKIADLQMEQRYQAALDATRGLGPDAATAQQGVLSAYQKRKQELESLAATSTDPIEVRKQLTPVIEGTWGVNAADADWAKALLRQAETRIANLPPVPVAPVVPLTSTTTAVVTPLAATTSEAGTLADPGATADQRLDQALVLVQPALAAAALAGTDATTPDGRAMRRKVELWNQRAAFLARAAQAKTVPLRIPHPTTGDSCDVVAVDAKGVEVTSPGGTRSSLDWAQLQAKDVGKVFLDATALPDVTVDEQAIAVAMGLVGGDQANAVVLLRKARPAMTPELASDVDQLVLLNRRHALLPVLAKAQDAVRSSNARVLGDCLTEIRKADRSVQAALVDQVATIEAALAKAQAAKGTAPVGRDDTGFSATDDLMSFPDQVGTWQVQVSPGQCVNTSPSAMLARHDLSNAKTALVSLMVLQGGKGTVTLDFRGVRTVLDLAAGSAAISGATTGKAKPFPVIARALIPVFMERIDERKVKVTLGNAVEVQEVAVNALDDNLTISVDGGATIALDEVRLTREASKAGANAGSGLSSAMKDKQDALRHQGWEPIGNAYFEVPSIVLPPSAGQASGVATAIKDGIAGYTFEAKGQGKLTIQLGKLGDRETKWLAVDIELPKNLEESLALSISYSATLLTITGPKGELLGKEDIKDAFTHLMIIASSQATLLSSPKPQFK